ncbi:hypothetical protein K505DRAFT_407283 [Melanomma pulvis-pyrius CBS 109.77]|uniref:Uncharacterized protein n=1 Tax=Melanomma pulvis-pyrius CBS 109.77 TaxID=1314802 RepID=A0A6A6XGR4_9PLEO|nr:hypothetical protein K505DRAFT_407283 [Melanomma pulvis-pyrius CBS 109.77]
MQAKEFVSISEDKAGLDRSNINEHDQVQLVQHHADTNPIDTPGPNAEENARVSSGHHIRKSISEKRHDAAIKLRKKLHIGKASDEPNPQDEILANAIEEKSDSRLDSSPPLPEKTTLRDALHNPIDTVKSKVSGQGNHQVAANIAAKEIPHGRDVDLLNAQATVECAQTDTEKMLATQTVEDLMKERQNMFVRWTLDRHVTKVRVLPKDTFILKSRASLQQLKKVKLLEYFAQRYGGQYVGYGSDPPPPSKESIMPNVERLIVASAPLQEIIMTTRRVYMWEERAETLKYLSIYLGLWYFNLILPGILSAIIYFVVDRHFHGNTLKNLREDVKRTENVHMTALTLTEFIEKKGDELWADELLEGLGPWLMVQLCDMANFFEVMRNFYEWRRPSRTIVTLGLIVLAIIGTAITPVWLLVKCATLSAGITFFGLFPIASNFPEYRLLASPVKRIFWNIPTHAQWSIQSIQAEGTRYQSEHSPPLPPSLHIKTSPYVTNISREVSEPHDHGSYTAHHSGSKGQLIISTTSIRFESRSLTQTMKIHFTLLFSQIQNLEKVDRIVSKNMPKPKLDTGKDLKIVSQGGAKYLVENVDQRDQVFSQVLGFSNAAWQVVW